MQQVLAHSESPRFSYQKDLVACADAPDVLDRLCIVPVFM